MQQIVPGLSVEGSHPFGEPDTGRRALTLAAISLLLVGASVLAPGCGAAMIWSAESRSPDGMWLASGRTIENAGPGTNDVNTAVYLKRANGLGPSEMILSLAEGPVVPPSITGVRMEWLTPKHLELTYAGGRVLAYRASQSFGIDITVQEFSKIDWGNSRRNEEIGRALENRK